jgi:hypothetical protein
MLTLDGVVLTPFSITVNAEAGAVVALKASLNVIVRVVPSVFTDELSRVGATWSTVDEFVIERLVIVIASLPAVS